MRTARFIANPTLAVIARLVLQGGDLLASEKLLSVGSAKKRFATVVMGCKFRRCWNLPPRDFSPANRQLERVKIRPAFSLTSPREHDFGCAIINNH